MIEPTTSFRNAPEESVFIPLWVQNQRRLFGFIVALVHDVTDAEDVLQRTSLILWRKFDQFQLGTDFFRWGCRVAYLEVQDYLQRKRRSRVAFSTEMVAQLAEASVAASSQWESCRTALAACLDKLRPADRHLVKQCYAGEKAFKEVAQKLGRPENSVYQSLGRIRRTLLECIRRTLSLAGEA